VAATAGRLDPDQVTYGWIRNTLEIDRVALSSNLRTEIDARPGIEIEREVDVEWDRQGNLVSPLSRTEPPTVS
jgi:hypothetical protein